MLDELLQKGRKICGIKGETASFVSNARNSTKTSRKPVGGKKPSRPTRPSRGSKPARAPRPAKPTSKRKKNSDKDKKPRRRGKRDAGDVREIFNTVRGIASAVRSNGPGGGIGGFITGIKDTVKSFTEGGGPMDGIITQIANIVGFNISSSADIVPTLFMKAFTEVTVSK